MVSIKIDADTQALQAELKRIEGIRNKMAQGNLTGITQADIDRVKRLNDEIQRLAQTNNRFRQIIGNTGGFGLDPSKMSPGDAALYQQNMARATVNAGYTTSSWGGAASSDPLIREYYRQQASQQRQDAEAAQRQERRWKEYQARNPALGERLRATGQEGLAPHEIRWGDLYGGDVQRARTTQRRALEHVMGQGDDPTGIAGPGLMQGMMPGLFRPISAGGMVSSAMGMLKWPMGMLGVGSIASLLGTAWSGGTELGGIVSKLSRSSPFGDYDKTKDALHEFSLGLVETASDFGQLAQHFSAASGKMLGVGKEQDELLSDTKNAVEMAKALGMDEAGVVQATGAMSFANSATGTAGFNTREFAAIFADTLGKTGMWAKSGEVLSDLSKYVSTTMGRSFTGGSLIDFARQYSAMNLAAQAAGLPGLAGQGAGRFLEQLGATGGYKAGSEHWQATKWAVAAGRFGLYNPAEVKEFMERDPYTPTKDRNGNLISPMEAYMEHALRTAPGDMRDRAYFVSEQTGLSETGVLTWMQAKRDREADPVKYRDWMQDYNLDGAGLAGQMEAYKLYHSYSGKGRIDALSRSTESLLNGGAMQTDAEARAKLSDAFTTFKKAGDKPLGQSDADVDEFMKVLLPAVGKFTTADKLDEHQSLMSAINRLHDDVVKLLDPILGAVQVSASVLTSTLEFLSGNKFSEWWSSWSSKVTGVTGGVTSKAADVFLEEEAKRRGIALLPGAKEPTASVDVAGYINRAATEFGVSPAVLSGLVSIESEFNPKAKSPDGGVGLSQLMPDTIQEAAAALGLTPDEIRNNPQANVRAGAWYLSKQIKAQGGDVAKGLAAYNAGGRHVTEAAQAAAFNDEPENWERYMNSKYLNMAKARSGGLTYSQEVLRRSGLYTAPVLPAEAATAPGAALPLDEFQKLLDENAKKNEAYLKRYEENQMGEAHDAAKDKPESGQREILGTPKSLLTPPETGSGPEVPPWDIDRSIPWMKGSEYGPQSGVGAVMNKLVLVLRREDAAGRSLGPDVEHVVDMGNARMPSLLNLAV